MLTQDLDTATTRCSGYTVTVGGDEGHSPVLSVILTFHPSAVQQRGQPTGPTGQRRLARRRTWSRRGSSTRPGRWSTNTLFPRRAVSQHTIYAEVTVPPLNLLHCASSLTLDPFGLRPSPTPLSPLLRTAAFPSIGRRPRRRRRSLGAPRRPAVAGLHSAAGAPR